MTSYIKSIIAFTFFLITSFQCRNDLLELAKRSDLKLTPNPVLMENSNAQFDILVTFPPNKILPNSDSVTFEISTMHGQEKIIVGRSSMSTIDLNKNKLMEHFSQYNLQIDIASDTIPLFFKQQVHKNGRMAETETIRIGSIVENER